MLYQVLMKMIAADLVNWIKLYFDLEKLYLNDEGVVFHEITSPEPEEIERRNCYYSNGGLSKYCLTF